MTCTYFIAFVHKELSNTLRWSSCVPPLFETSRKISGKLGNQYWKPDPTLFSAFFFCLNGDCFQRGINLILFDSWVFSCEMFFHKQICTQPPFRRPTMYIVFIGPKLRIHWLHGLLGSRYSCTSIRQITVVSLLGISFLTFLAHFLP